MEGDYLPPESAENPDSKGGSKAKTPGARGRKKGSGIPAKGAGWGGPAKGAHPDKERVLPGAGPGRGHFSATGEAIRDRQARHAEEMREILYTVAHTADKDETRIAAADKLLNRIEGLPVQRILSAELDPYATLSDEQLAEAAREQDALAETYAKAVGGE